MSSIEKMSIQGIRSFGPEDQDKQVIQFFKPLTLILGPNGTGKTTIIECLKYITTGDQPPNSTKNCAFIHDPKIAGEREVKGQIRLQLRDVTGKQVLVTRSVTATQKLKKIEMKTLEGVITRHGPDGEKKSINSRCADMTREMITSLGVSKAVLDNVIFCHQEDANWPLSEGKPLKEKFDAIFASTRYTKVLETIRKLKQQQDAEIKMFKEELKYLKQHKDKSVQIQGDLAELNVRYETSEENVTQIESELKPLQEKLQQLGTRLQETYEISGSIQSRENEKVQIDTNIAELLSNIENEFQGSSEELKQMLREFQKKMEERQDTLQQYERRKEVLTKDLERSGRQKSVILVEVGKLEQEAAMYQDNLKKRDQLIVQYSSDYSFQGFESLAEISDEQYRNFFENMKNLLETRKLQSRTIKAEFEEEEKKLQKKLDDLKENKTKLESNERIKKELMGKNTGEIRQINQKLSQMEASAGRLETITTDLNRVEQELSSTESTTDIESIKQEISQMDKQRRELDSKLSTLSTELNKLTLESESQTKLDMLKKDKVTKEDHIRRLKAKHEDTIVYLLNEMPTSNLRGRLEAYIGEQKDIVYQCSSELQKANKIITTKEAEKTMIQHQLKQKEEELRTLDEKIFNVCGSQNYDEEYQNIQQKLTTAQESRGSLLGAEHFFKKYVSDLEKPSPCCPLCHRDFDNEQDVRELILELQNKLRMVPGKLQKSEKDLQDQQKKYDNMTQLKPLKENIATLNDTTIPNLKTKLKKLNEEITKQREIIENKTEEYHAKENDEAMGKNMQPDMVMMDRYLAEVKDLDKKINNMAATLSGGDSGRTIKMVVDEKGDLQHTLDNLNKTLDHKRQKMASQSDNLQRLRTEVNELKSEKLQITSQLQQRVKLEETKTTLVQDNQTLEDEIKEAREQIQPLEKQIERVKTQGEDVKRRKDENVEIANQEVEVVKNNGNKVKNYNALLKEYNQKGRGEKLDELKEKQTEIMNEVKKKELEQIELSENINKLNKDLTTQKVRERELADNLQLRKKKSELRKLDTEIKELQGKLGDIDIDNIERERRNLLKKESNLQKERLTSTGRLQGLKDQIQSCKKELNSDMFKDASEKYRDKVIDMRTTELSNKDLEKYYKAMDRAIMNYHNQKMAEINKIIRELWRNTYKGNDIETIEIQSGDEDGSTLKTKRIYNYKVVMIKSGVEIDMRGRCSAGQKVLASLIIRLALAETFCVNCGILALDEPTTNLDRENIEGLAYALVEIIKSRADQSNFQLVVITHDEDFVELLGRSEYVEEFYKVRKNQHGCSNLFKAHVSDLHMGR